MRNIRIAAALAALLVWPGTSFAQNTRVLENDRVVVWSVPAPANAPHAHTDDVGSEMVSVTMDGDAVRVTRADGSAVLVQLKSAGPAPAVSPHPPAFPREGTTKVLENARVAVWDVRWSAGAAGLLHTHPYDNVNITLTGGSTRSIPLDAPPTDTTVKPGDVAFNVRNRVHREQGLPGPQRRGIVVELK